MNVGTDTHLNLHFYNESSIAFKTEMMHYIKHIFETQSSLYTFQDDFHK